MSKIVIVYNAKRINYDIDQFIKANGSHITADDLRPILVSNRSRVEVQ